MSGTRLALSWPMAAPQTSLCSATSPGPQPVAVVAACELPFGAYSVPSLTKLDLTKIFDNKPIDDCVRVFVSNSGLLYTEQAIDWIRIVRIAQNCYEQNVIAIAADSQHLVIKTIRPVLKGQELLVWPSISVMNALNIPFLTLSNIINEHCYQCHRCGHNFRQPNPLKVHLMAKCSPLLCYSPDVTIGQNSVESVSDTCDQDQHHLGKGHTCVYCGKSYTRKYGLKIHERTHTGDKPLRCRYCGRPFSDPSNLNKHVRLHGQHQSSDNIRNPYKCKYCSKILIRRRDLDRHLKTRHHCIA